MPEELYIPIDFDKMESDDEELLNKFSRTANAILSKMELDLGTVLERGTSK